MLRRSTRPVGAAAARRAAAALLHLRLGFTEYICSVSLTYTHALLTPLHAAAVATHTATPLLLNMHTYLDATSVDLHHQQQPVSIWLLVLCCRWLFMN